MEVADIRKAWDAVMANGMKPDTDISLAVSKDKSKAGVNLQAGMHR